jgi:HEPN domain-containing protein
MDDSLSFESFYEGAKKAAHRAMDDHGRGGYDEFALHAGVAVEKLAEAVLVSKNGASAKTRWADHGDHC